MATLQTCSFLLHVLFVQETIYTFLVDIPFSKSKYDCCLMTKKLQSLQHLVPYWVNCYISLYGWQSCTLCLSKPVNPFLQRIWPARHSPLSDIFSWLSASWLGRLLKSPHQENLATVRKLDYLGTRALVILEPNVLNWSCKDWMEKAHLDLGWRK